MLCRGACHCHAFDGAAAGTCPLTHACRCWLCLPRYVSSGAGRRRSARASAYRARHGWTLSAAAVAAHGGWGASTRERGRVRKCLTACTGLCRRAGRGRDLRCRCARDAGSPGGRHGGRAAAHQRPPAGAAVAPPGRLRWQACTNQSRGCTNVGWEARQGACMAGSVTYPAHVHAQVAERCRTRTVPNHDYSRFDSGARARSLAGGPCGGGRRAAGV